MLTAGDPGGPGGPSGPGGPCSPWRGGTSGYVTGILHDSLTTQLNLQSACMGLAGEITATAGHTLVVSRARHKCIVILALTRNRLSLSHGFFFMRDL